MLLNFPRCHANISCAAQIAFPLQASFQTLLRNHCNVNLCKLLRTSPMGGGQKEFGAMYYIGGINTGVPPYLLGVSSVWAGGSITP